MKKMTAKRWLVLALVLVFVGFIGASLIQTDFGNVSITKLNKNHRKGSILYETGMARRIPLYR